MRTPKTFFATRAAVLANGARQTDKTALAQAIAAKTGAQQLTLDDAATLGLAAVDPAGQIADEAGRMVLDEVQKVADLFSAVKLAVDRERRQCV